MTYKWIAADTSEAVVTLQGIDQVDRAVRRDLTRSRFKACMQTDIDEIDRELASAGPRLSVGSHPMTG